MVKGGSTLASLAVAVAMAFGVFLAVDGNPLVGEPGNSAGRFGLAGDVMAAGAKSNPAGKARSVAAKWTASAPGRVEPRKGELKISSQARGRIIEVLVKLNDAVRAGDLMVRLDDDEARARLRAASALADAKKRSRDNEDVNRLANNRRKADDSVHKARRKLRERREELDGEAAKLRAGEGSAEKLDEARTKITQAEEALSKARTRLRRTRAARKVPLETTKESALSAARTEVALAAVALERTQIRAPVDGTIMELNAKAGETVTPSPRSVLVRMGDLTALRIRAEVEERDVGNVHVGQVIVARSKAFPGKDMAGRVSTLAPRLGPNEIAAKGPRRPTDLDVLEAMIELDGLPPLLPGMRVDVFFVPGEPVPDKSVSDKSVTDKTVPDKTTAKTKTTEKSTN